MADAAIQPATPPPGQKLLAWEGVGLFAPMRWDISRYHGNHDRGEFHVTSPSRDMVHVEWWTERKPISIDRLVEQYAKRRPRERKSNAPDAVVRNTHLAAVDAPYQAFTNLPSDDSRQSPREVLVAWNNVAAGRVGIWRFVSEQNSFSDELLRSMLNGLRLQAAEQWRDWAAFDFALQSPPGYELDKASLGCGVCLLQFTNNKQQVAMRRFTAISAAIEHDANPTAALQRWCRAVYAPEFHDMRYDVEEHPATDRRVSIVLRGRRRWRAAAEWLPPLARHRKSPAEVRLTWDVNADKIYAVECRKPALGDAAVGAFESSIQMTLAPDVAKQPGGARTQTQRRIRPNVGVVTTTNSNQRTVLRYERVRPAPLRALRVLAAQPAGAASPAVLELDAIGSMVWQLCDGQHVVGDVVEHLMRRFQISYREAELSATNYLHQLTDRGLLVVESPGNQPTPEANPSVGESGFTQA